MNDRERKDNELGIDLDMKGLTLDSDEAAKPQAQNRPVSHEDMARMIAKIWQCRTAALTSLSLP